MGIHLQDIDDSNILQAIQLYRSANILKWIPAQLVNAENCLAAVQVNGLALKYVPERLAVMGIILAAIEQNHQSVWARSKPTITRPLIAAAVDSLIKQCKAARYFTFLDFKHKHTYEND